MEKKGIIYGRGLEQKAKRQNRIGKEVSGWNTVCSRIGEGVEEKWKRTDIRLE